MKICSLFNVVNICVYIFEKVYPTFDCILRRRKL